MLLASYFLLLTSYHAGIHGLPELMEGLPSAQVDAAVAWCVAKGAGSVQEIVLLNQEAAFTQALKIPKGLAGVEARTLLRKRLQNTAKELGRY